MADAMIEPRLNTGRMQEGTLKRQYSSLPKRILAYFSIVLMIGRSQETPEGSQSMAKNFDASCDRITSVWAMGGTLLKITSVVMTLGHRLASSAPGECVLVARPSRFSLAFSLSNPVCLRA